MRPRGQTRVGAAAHARVLALGVLADEEHVDVCGAATGERVADAREQAHGPDVRPQVEPLAQLEQQAPERDVVGDARRADGAEQHGVERADSFDRVRGHHPAVFLVVGAAPGELDPFDRHAGRVDDGARLGDHLRSDSVPCDHRDTVHCHVSPSRVTAHSARVARRHASGGTLTPARHRAASRDARRTRPESRAERSAPTISPSLSHADTVPSCGSDVSQEPPSALQPCSSGLRHSTPSAPPPRSRPCASPVRSPALPRRSPRSATRSTRGSLLDRAVGTRHRSPGRPAMTPRYAASTGGCWRCIRRSAGIATCSRRTARRSATWRDRCRWPPITARS